MKIKDLPKVERPREKLAKYGPQKLSNTELLAILLRTGRENLNVVELSANILKKFGSKGLAMASVQELKNVHGLGLAKACEIAACFELGRRLLDEDSGGLYLTPEDVWKGLRDIAGNKKEHFVVFYLDSRNQEIARETVGIGTLNESLVHPREVFEPAVRHSAAGVIIAHNHPSGDPDPSQEDREVTVRLAQAGKLLGIELIDHVVIAKSGFKSFREAGYL